MDNYNRLVFDELTYNKDELRVLFQTAYPTLTDEQKCIFSTVIDHVDNDKGGMFFVYGYGGTGKTYLYKIITAAIKSEGGIILNVASSGIVALFYDNDLADLIRKTKLIIWDEAPMVHRHCFEALERTMADISRNNDGTQSDNVFGGKVVLFGGDFRQILPVIPCGLNSVEKAEIKEFADWILDFGDVDSTVDVEYYDNFIDDEAAVDETTHDEATDDDFDI
ncbi:ATP-dependent DNA helicase PIF1-like protein [Tanacetum coccineum]